MAETNPEQDNLFKEIDEDLRHERFAKLWKRFGKYIIGVAVVIVVAVGGVQAWRAWQTEQRMAEGARFTAALREVDENRIENAAARMASLAEEGSTGYTLLARFNEAGLRAQSGDTTGAAERYMAIAEDGGVDGLYRDLARLLATIHEADRGRPQALIERLAPLTEGSNPWRHSAREMTAMLTRRAGNAERAVQLYRELADDTAAPSGVRARAAEIAAIIGG